MTTAEPIRSTVPVTAILITKNAERYLERVLASVAMCAERLVLDCGSTDDTRAIASACGARVEHQDWLGYGPQKNEAARRARHDWVFSIDADEILDPTGQAALAAFAPDRTDPTTVFRLRRRNHVAGREIRHGGWAPDYTRRLYHRHQAAFNDTPIHEAVVAPGPVETLPGSLLHYSYDDLAAVFRLDYHRLKAARYRAAGRRASAPALALRAVWGFTKSYLLRRGFLDGVPGVMVACSVALNDTLGLAMASLEADAAPGREDGAQAGA